MIRSIFLFTVLAVLTAFLLPWLILWTVITNNSEAMYNTAMKAIRFLLRIIGVRVHVEGLDNIPTRVCIFAANHISTIDPLAFIPAIPRRVAILVKQELFRIPLLGTAMKKAQFVPVDRSDREAAAASVDLSIDRLKHGTSFAIYPEGTRSPDGRLRPLKKGAFTMAVGAAVPIVPVSIAGAQKIMQKGSWKVFGGDITVRFGKPVDGAEYTPESRDALRDKVEALITAGLPEEQRPSAGNG
ncbi:MAG TPA: lysophospholipid acyltransferase family protein [Candidatus Acidoferrales bacterium]|nr:lysophospholipid acyltransferase family protein [Candidatus Acidoferrales bacterium]